MSVQIPTDLYERIVEALSYGEERDALIALTTLSNSAQASEQVKEKSVTLTIPERAASHFAYALMLGGTTAKMCDRDPQSVKALYDAGNRVKALVPSAFDDFLHQSDVEKAMDLLVYRGAVASAKSGWGSHDLLLSCEGRSDWSPMFQNGNKVTKERVDVIVAELNAFAERCRVIDAPQIDDDDGYDF